MKKYNLYYTQFQIMAMGEIDFIETVETDDIYHYIGKKICTSLEHISHIRYTELRIPLERCEELWKEAGYEKIGNRWWRKHEK